MAKKSGFTLIEMVIVIVILAIVSAVAAPKFINLQRDARIALIKDISAAMHASSKLVQSKAHVNKIHDGELTIGSNTVKIEGGYIAGHWNDSWRYAIELSKEVGFTRKNSVCTTHEICGVGNQRRVPGLPITTNQRGVVAIWLEDFSLSDGCYVYYYNPNTPNNSDDTVPPTIGTVTTGC